MRRLCICIIWEGEDEDDGMDDDDDDKGSCCDDDDGDDGDEDCVMGLTDDDDPLLLFPFMRISRGSLRLNIEVVDPRGKEPSLYLAICAGSIVQ